MANWGRNWLDQVSGRDGEGRLHGQVSSGHADPNDEQCRLLLAAIERRPRMLTPGGGRSWPDKKLIEIGAVEDLVKGLRAKGERELTDIQPRPETRPPTSPEVLARNERGGLVGIEVAELCDEEVIKRNIPLSRVRFQAIRNATSSEARADALAQHPEKVRLWSGAELVAEVACIIAKKDRRTFAADVEPFGERWLVIHTAEPFVDWGEFTAQLRHERFSSSQFDHVYLVRDFDPATRSYPYWRIIPSPD